MDSAFQQLLEQYETAMYIIERRITITDEHGSSVPPEELAHAVRSRKRLIVKHDLPNMCVYKLEDNPAYTGEQKSFIEWMSNERP